METDAIELENLINQYSYLGIFIWFMTLDQLTPIPEEVSLIIIGYLSTQTSLNPLWCGLASLMGLIAIDNIYYFLTSKGSRFTKRLFKKHKQNSLLQKLKQKVHENSWLYLFIIEFIPRFRILSPVIASVSDIQWKKFNLINTTATSLIVAIYILIGIFFNNSLNYIFKGLETIRHLIFALVLLSIIIFIWRFLTKNGN